MHSSQFPSRRATPPKACGTSLQPGNLSEIAKHLGVTNILEGSVQKVGDQVRGPWQLNPQTILRQSSRFCFHKADRTGFPFPINISFPASELSGLQTHIEATESVLLSLQMKTSLHFRNSNRRFRACLFHFRSVTLGLRSRNRH